MADDTRDARLSAASMPSSTGRGHPGGTSWLGHLSQVEAFPELKYEYGHALHLVEPLALLKALTGHARQAVRAVRLEKVPAVQLTQGPCPEVFFIVPF